MTDTREFIEPRFGLRVIVLETMAGAKRAVQTGSRLYVSPAMWDLISHSDGEELAAMLRRISVLQVFSPAIDIELGYPIM